jgi:hypothetical protein
MKMNLPGRSRTIRLGTEQRYPAAQVNDQVQIDLALTPEELDISARHFQRELAGD